MNPGLLSSSLLGALAVFAAAQTPATLSQKAPAEIEALQAPYLRNVAAIRAARDTRSAPITRSYLANLDRLKSETTSRGDLDGALLVKDEHERVTGGEEPSTDERKTMPAPLAALRTRYEKDREQIFSAARQQEEQQTRAYLAALELLQKRLTTQNQLDKAVIVKAERERMATLAADAAVVATPETAPGAPTSKSAARLDPGFAKKIAAVVRSQTYTKTDSSAEPGGGTDVPEGGSVLVGFEFLEDKSEGVADVRSIRPFFLTREGIIAGRDRGELAKVTAKVLARNGYAVAGLTTYQNPSRIQGIQVTFMKIDPSAGRLDSSPANTYKSTWFGSRGRGKARQLGGDGRAVIGVFGKTGADADTIGLVQMPVAP